MILSYQYLLENKTHYYDKREIKRLLIKSKKSKSRRIARKSKEVLFLSLSNIVIKNIENFFNILYRKGYIKDNIHCKDELISECYIVLDKCVEKFAFNKGTIFYWYYNRALTNRMSRIIEKIYYKHRSAYRIESSSHEYYIETKQLVDIETDFIGFYYDTLKLTEEEIKIIEAKLHKTSIKDLIEEELQITQNEYYKTVSRIKTKFQNLR